MGAPTFVDEDHGVLGGGDSRTFTLPAYTAGEDVLMVFAHHSDLFFANSFILVWGGSLAPTADVVMSNGVQDNVEVHFIKTQVGDAETEVKAFNTRSASGDELAVLVYGPDNESMVFYAQSSNEGVEMPTGGGDSGTQTFDAITHDLGAGQ